MKDNKDIRTLCIHCREDYITAGYRLILVPHQEDMSVCDKCGRRGFDYLVKDKHHVKVL